jgi:TetR/AcrR family transcriptional repressor of nem operon
MSTAPNPARSDRTAARDPVRTRQSLLQAASEEIHRAGFRGSDLDTILRRTGVTKGAMYHHFENKEALGYAVLEEVIARIMREKWQVPLAQADDPIDALIAIVEATSLMPEHVSCGCPLNNLSQEMSPLDEGFRRCTAKLFDAWHDAIAVALHTGQARGTVRRDVDPGATATFLIAAYEGYMSLGKCFRDVDRMRDGQAMLVRYLASLRPRRRSRASGTQPN